MSAYVLSEDAGFDLDEVWEYIAQDNLEAADRWIVKLFDTFEAIAQSPRHRPYTRRFHQLPGTVFPSWGVPCNLSRHPPAYRDRRRYPRFARHSVFP